MARYKETNSVILKLFPKTMQVPIIKNLMAPHTQRKKIRKALEKEFLLFKKNGIFANKIHCQVLSE